MHLVISIWRCETQLTTESSDFVNASSKRISYQQREITSLTFSNEKALDDVD